MSADVAKMYRQIELKEKDRDYHRLLWRFNTNEPVLTFRMTRVTYGVASSSYHAIRSLIKCASFDKVPIAVRQAIERDFYVDDVLTGASSESEAKELQDGLISTLKQAQFELRKWTCSNSNVTRSLPAEYREENGSHEFSEENRTIKTLTIVWNPSSDQISFKVAQLNTDLGTNQLTKRQVLSDISKVFDPLG